MTCWVPGWQRPATPPVPGERQTAESFGNALRRLRGQALLSLRELARRAAVDPGHLSRIEAGHRPPTPQIAAALDSALNAAGVLTALARNVPAMPGAKRLLDDERDAYELADRVEASDVSAATLRGLDVAVDQAAIAYHSTPPAQLLAEVRRYLDHVSDLLNKRMTLRQRAQLLAIGGWLSLLGATLHIDLGNRRAATARLATARSLALHIGHAELTAWCLETQAWDALTEGEYRSAVELSRASQGIAPQDSSALIQATAQEGRASAKLGDQRGTRAALTRVERYVSPLPKPDQPEHHYRYDPDKQLAYTATTLAWVRDPAAVDYAGSVLDHLDPHGDGGTRPRRVAVARLDLALALLSAERADEAAGQALQAIESGRIVPSHAWRVGEVVRGVEAAGTTSATELRDAYRTINVS